MQFVIIGFFTLITLGLYIILGCSSTRMLRWQYDHTLLPNGQRMDYHGKAVDIFWEWLLLVLFTPLTLGLYYYWGPQTVWRRLVLTNVSLDDQQIQVEGSAGEYVVAVFEQLDHDRDRSSRLCSSGLFAVGSPRGQHSLDRNVGATPKAAPSRPGPTSC